MMDGVVEPVGDFGPRRDFRSLVTDQIRTLLESRTIRFAVVGLMCVVASSFTLVPAPGIDPGWLFIVPVVIAAIAGGLREGMAVALISALSFASFDAANHGAIIWDEFFGAAASRFAMYGITAGFLGVFAEAHYAVAANLREMATTDPLTQVANMSTFYDQVGELINTQIPFAILLVDVDDLKFLNDRYGHATGSAAIQIVARVLKRVTRATDFVARYGGDEFVVVLREADHTGAQIVSNRVRSILLNETLADAGERKVTVSIGVAVQGLEGETAEELLEAADAAMYVDKRGHKEDVPTEVG